MESAVEHEADEDDSNPQCRKKTKIYKQESGKGTWMITYTALSPDITHTMLHTHSITCDECYTITWRESKYTLIHIKQSGKTRLSAMNKAMKMLEADFKVKGSSIIGYETLYCNERNDTSITDHPAFKRMVELINKNGDLATWLAEGDVFSNKKGLLWKHISSIDPKHKTHGQLAQQVRELIPVVEESKAIKTENEVLRSTLIMREKELADAHKTISAYDAHNEKLTRDLIKKGAECTALKMRLIQNNMDHTLPDDQ
jgi:hypothetical protein